jgi:hypothetical protein
MEYASQDRACPFNGSKLRHSTSNQLFTIKRKSTNSKPPMATSDNKEHTAAEGPEISIVNKRKPLKRPED